MTTRLAIAVDASGDVFVSRYSADSDGRRLPDHLKYSNAGAALWLITFQQAILQLRRPGQRHGGGSQQEGVRDGIYRGNRTR